MLDPNDLKEIKSIIDLSVKENIEPRFDTIDSRFESIDSRFDSLEDKIDALAIATKKQFDVIDSDIKEIKVDLKRVIKIQLSHETRLINLEA